MDRMRCSRFVLTLFSCPEYVLITYQRNMPTSLQKDVADEGADQLVDAPEIGTDDEHGDDDDDGSLDRLGPVRPVDLAELGHRLADEATAAAGLVLQRRDRSATRCSRLRQAARLAHRLVTGCATGVAPLPAGLVGHRLTGLAMDRVGAAPTAVLLELDPVGRVSLRLLGLVVPSLALRAGERDCDSDSGCHGFFSLSGTEKGAR